ncbi:MAG: hypothetical protein Q8M29_19780 [Bacteroidota bacterium]|nr:hypothetical protein [Bacteroidota bacterium]
MSLKNIALIVDGPTEEGSLRLKFQMKYCDCPNLRIGPGNGITYTTEGYAKGVLPTLIYLLNSSVRAIILIPDLEKRKVTPADFANNLKKTIVDFLLAETSFLKPHLEETIHICPPDIMFENWIVSDVEGIKDGNSLIHAGAVQKDFDGKNGTSELQKLMTTKYKKTVHAKLLYKKTDDERSANNSSSFKSFIDSFHQLYTKHCL